MNNKIPERINTSLFSFVKLEVVLGIVNLYLNNDSCSEKTLSTGMVSANKIWKLIEESSCSDAEEGYSYIVSNL